MTVVGVDHISLLVADTARALAFYEGVLGIRRAERPALGFRGAWLTVGAQQIHLLELPGPDPAEGRPAHGGRDRHLALVVTDLTSVIEHLESAGVVYTRSRSGRPAVFCRDPDGNALELMEKM